MMFVVVYYVTIGKRFIVKLPKWNKRFLASTRGRIIELLRSSERTVNELAEEVQLTDNAVRAHLSTLERDGLVRQKGERPGLRKPHAVYQLTTEAEQLFPKAYAPLLGQFLDVLDEQIGASELKAALREVGRRMAEGYLPAAQDKDLESRVQLVKDLFNELGGLAEVEKHDGHYIIRGDSCPLAAVSGSHPQVCCLAEALATEIVGVPAREKCQCRDGEPPQCRLEIDAET
jgi:predicted ArsR family transcriptional regulator